MTKHPGKIVNSITFFHNPYNSQQTTIMAPHSQPAINLSHTSSPVIGASISENLFHPSHQASCPQIFYSTVTEVTKVKYTIPPSSSSTSFTTFPGNKSTSSSKSPTTSPEDKFTSMDWRKAQKLEKNRIAAKECRERKKAYIVNLENKASRLEDDNLILRQKIKELETKLEWAESKHQENIQLKKLIEELKEKVIKMESGADVNVGKF